MVGFAAFFAIKREEKEFRRLFGHSLVSRCEEEEAHSWNARNDVISPTTLIPAPETEELSQFSLSISFLFPARVLRILLLAAFGLDREDVSRVGVGGEAEIAFLDQVNVK